jgi:hypothetical protein
VTRFRLFIVVFLVALVLAVPAAAAYSQEEAPPSPEPAVVLESEQADEDDEAWTFRFLVPTVLALTALTVAGTAVAYGLRVRGRYRVAR